MENQFSWSFVYCGMDLTE